jgi:hypothetical protein
MPLKICCIHHTVCTLTPGKANAEASQHVRNVLMALYRRRLFWRLRRRPPRPVVGEAGMICPCRMASIGTAMRWKESSYRSGRSPDWLKMKNANAPAVKREAEEDWGR